MRLHHTGLTVSDLDRALAFWRDALGLETVMEGERQGGYFEAIVGEPGVDVRMVHLAYAPGGPRIELFEYRSPRGGRHVSRPADVGFAHVCVECEDAEALVGRLVAAGGVPFGPTVAVDSGVNAGARAVYVRDPDGHVVEVLQPGSGP